MITHLPKRKILKVSSQNTVVLENCFIAASISSRFWGLMGIGEISKDCGLFLEPCNSIHTFFMKFPIDVFYLKREKEKFYKVIGLVRDKKPWRMDFPVFSANAVLETSSKSKLDLKLGDLVCLS